MFGKRKCSLCGGKLVDNKCTLCGLDNSKSDENYKQTEIRVNDPEKRESEPEQLKNHQEKKKRDRNVQNGPILEERGKKFGKGLLAIIVSIITVVGVDTLLDLAVDIKDYIGQSVHEEENVEFVEEEPDYKEYMYDFVTRELSEEGENYEAELGAGQYIVGVHLPEGTYQVMKSSEQTNVEYGYLIVDDFENSIYLGEDFTDPGTEISDVRCYNGAVIRISGKGKLHFYSENAQIDSMTGVENALTEAVEVRDNSVAGVDFPAGVYDIVEQKNPELYMDFTYVLPATLTQEMEKQGFSYQEEFLWITAEEGPYTYRNLWLPEGTELTIREAEMLHLEPSAVVPEDEKAFCHQNK